MNLCWNENTRSNSRFSGWKYILPCPAFLALVGFRSDSRSLAAFAATGKGGIGPVETTAGSVYRLCNGSIRGWVAAGSAGGGGPEVVLLAWLTWAKKAATLPPPPFSLFSSFRCSLTLKSRKSFSPPEGLVSWLLGLGAGFLLKKDSSFVWIRLVWF